jgi:2-dehydro-3-deoxy-D-arabinonate dehydratase
MNDQRGMKVCKFTLNSENARAGLLTEASTVVDLTPLGILTLEMLLESEDVSGLLSRRVQAMLQEYPLDQVRLCAPLDQQEVWAAGVTYSRSKVARMEESEFSASAYDLVYEAARPELFFKSMPQKVAGPGEAVGIRADARWNVPEPELALVLNSRGAVVGYTIGNDMSSRDIEGENLLYLPQAKIYRRSCALGPWIQLGATEEQARQWEIRMRIERDAKTVFSGETRADRIKRRFQELADYLFRSQEFPRGAILLTGTGVIPPDNMTLQADDLVEIEIAGIGLLRNRVVVV